MVDFVFDANRKKNSRPARDSSEDFSRATKKEPIYEKLQFKNQPLDSSQSDSSPESQFHQKMTLRDDYYMTMQNYTSEKIPGPDDDYEVCVYSTLTKNNKQNSKRAPIN